MSTLLAMAAGAVLFEVLQALGNVALFYWRARRRRTVLRPVEMVSIKPLSGRNERE